MAKGRKPFISRKRRKEIEVERTRREALFVAQERDRQDRQETVGQPKEKLPVSLPVSTTVGELANLLGLPVVRVISQLMRNGVMAAVSDWLDYDTMAIVADELGFVPTTSTTEAPLRAKVVLDDQTGPSETRPPVVAIMGHVDHGKTSLLDAIRQASVASTEHGGITQHIGAYQTTVTYEGKERAVTFLDTPGHEAFSALRAHGAQVTDIVVLVVAADDGVKPQTVEAIDHAKTANVPIIVAMTKVDLPTKNVDRVKQQLTEHGLIPEDWGGQTAVAEVSTVDRQGIQNLLEFIILTADLKNYRANPAAPGQGVVVESHQEIGLGPMATLLVQNGTLKLGDTVVMPQTYGRVRIMFDYQGKRVSQASPSTPVKVAGLTDIPEFGDAFAVVASEKAARELVGQTEAGEKRRPAGDITQAIAEGRANILPIVLKADTQGSIEGLKTALRDIAVPGAKLAIISHGVGDITLNDVQLAVAARGVIFGFHVSAPPAVKKVAATEGVLIATFLIIYDLVGKIELILKGRVKRSIVMVEQGRVKIKKIFRTTHDDQIVGGEIAQGVVTVNAEATIMREATEVGKGKITRLQKGPESLQELEAIQDCGLSVRTGTKILAGDVIIVSVEEEVVAGI